MKENWYKELERCISDINKMELGLNDEEKEKGRNCVALAAHDVVRIGRKGWDNKRKGIEDCLIEMERKRIGFLEKMIETYFDGMTLELAEEIFEIQYHALCLTGYERFCCFIYLCGFRSIVTYENPYRIEQKMISMMPIDWKVNYKQIVSEENPYYSFNLERKYESLYTGRLYVSQEDKDYMMMQMTDYAIRFMHENKLRQLIWNLDNDTLMKLAKGLSGEAREKMTNTMSVRAAGMLVDDMEIAGAVATQEVINATQEVFKKIVKIVVGEEEL